MDCERPGCGHPLALHDPCTAKNCRCTGYLPVDRKARVASITDIDPNRPKALSLGELRTREEQLFGGLK